MEKMNFLKLRETLSALTKKRKYMQYFTKADSFQWINCH